MDNNVSWKQALNRLKVGNANFVEDHLDGMLQNSSRRGELVAGQNPYAIILTCSDSRIVPELAFDTGLGELFVIRVAGNIANTSTIASIEYAVTYLNVKLIIVVGHENCGAITAALDGGDYGYNLNHLLAHMIPALNASKEKDVNTVVKINAHLTSKQLLSRSHIISDGVEKNALKVIPAFYNLATGIVDFFVGE